MAHGGKREGAGRKRGIPNKASQERQAKIAAGGETPLDVMVAGMRFHYAIATGLMAESEPDAKSIVAALDAAGEFAKDAAPYVHPRLTAVEATGKNGEPLIPEDAASNRTLAMAILSLLRGSVETPAEEPISADTQH